MTESDFWVDHVSDLKQFGKAKRLEDLLDKGTSDVVYCLRWLQEPPRMGWIELKRLPEWPKRRSTAISLPHYSTEQATFLESWGRAGAGAFLLAHVQDDFLLFPWQEAKRIQRGLLRPAFTAAAVVRSSGRFPLRDVLRCLTRT